VEPEDPTTSVRENLCLQMTTHDRHNFSCLEHVVNLGVVAVVSQITKIGAIENATAIWEYDPTLPSNSVLGGSLDVIAAIRTLAIKVHRFICYSIFAYVSFSQIQSSGQRIEYFEKCQLQCGITNPLKIPLHSNTRWGSAYSMLDRAYELQQAIKIFVATANAIYGPITTIRRDGRVSKHIPWTAFQAEKQDWKCVADTKKILAVSRTQFRVSTTVLTSCVKDSNGILHYFSSEHHASLWRAIPAMERLQTAWETKLANPRYELFKDALTDGLTKIKKYYLRFDEKPAYILALGMSRCLIFQVSPQRILTLINSFTSVLQALLHQDGLGWCRGAGSGDCQWQS
jgi:hypothetical protein